MLRELELEYELEAEFEGELDSEWETEWETEFEYELEDESAEREVIGRDTRRLVTNTRVAPYRYICSLVHNGRPAGSGTLIGPNTVLTAAHVIQGKTARNMIAIPGRNADRRRGDFRPFGTAQGAAFRFAPGYRGPADDVTPRDYGVVYLSQPIGNLVGHWTIAHTSSARDPLGTSISGAPLPRPPRALKVNLSGYPGDKGFNFGTPPQPLRQQWRAKNRAVRELNGMLHYRNDTFGGHSGCPVWVKRSASQGGRVMVGIHVGGDDPNIRGRANRGVRITPAILNVIRSWLRAAPPVRPVRPPVRPPRTWPTGPFRILDRFVLNSPAVQPHHRPLLAEVARAIVSGTPPVHTVRLVGHADSAGSDAYNLRLGQQRAAAVHSELLRAVDALRPGHSRRVQFVVQSLGEARPVAPNDTADNRARNRRVEIHLAGR